MRFLKLILGAVSILIISNVSAIAKYSASEIFVIPWGDNKGQLPIGFQNALNYRQLEGDNDLRHNYPDNFFVDIRGRLYIGNRRLKYIKIFDSQGVEHFTIPSTYTKPEWNSAFKPIKPNIGDQYKTLNYAAFCVDSQSRIYIQPLSPQGDRSYSEYVVLVDTTGIITGIIEPLKFGINKSFGEMRLNSKDVLTFGNFASESILIYRNGKLSEGGYVGWLGPDDYYYTARIDKTGYDRKRTIVEFTAIGDSTNPKIADDVKQTVCLLKEVPSQCELLGIANNGRMFLKLYTDAGTKIQIYDKQYTLLDEVRIPFLKSEPRFDHFRNLIVTGNGDIYEFHNLADGLHIIGWRDRDTQ